MRVKLENRIGIQAEPETVWSLVAGVADWPRWNPCCPEARGVVRIGEKIEYVAALPGMKPVKVAATVFDWVPNEQLHLAVTALGGLVRSTRYFEIEQLAPGSCIFSNGEMFGGPLGGMVARRYRQPIRAGFAAIGEAIKAAAEAKP